MLWRRHEGTGFISQFGALKFCQCLDFEPGSVWIFSGYSVFLPQYRCTLDYLETSNCPKVRVNGVCVLQGTGRLSKVLLAFDNLDRFQYLPTWLFLYGLCKLRIKLSEHEIPAGNCSLQSQCACGDKEKPGDDWSNFETWLQATDKSPIVLNCLYPPQNAKALLCRTVKHTWESMGGCRMTFLLEGLYKVRWHNIKFVSIRCKCWMVDCSGFSK